MPTQLACLARGAQQPLARPAAGVALHARGPVALDAALHPHEDLAVDGLRAGVAAPQPPGDRGEQEQRVGADDEQRGEVDEVLRVQHQPEKVEAARGQLEEHGLALVPHQPGCAVEDQLRQRDEDPAPAGEAAGDGTWVDLLVRGVKRDELGAVVGVGRRAGRAGLESGEVHAGSSASCLPCRPAHRCPGGPGPPRLPDAPPWQQLAEAWQ